MWLDLDYFIIVFPGILYRLLCIKIHLLQSNKWCIETIFRKFIILWSYIYGIRIKNYVINKMYLFLNYSGVYLNKDF